MKSLSGSKRKGKRKKAFVKTRQRLKENTKRNNPTMTRGLADNDFL
jgi:hypothetical protein